jgi:hypothetical protein
MLFRFLKKLWGRDYDKCPNCGSTNIDCKGQGIFGIATSANMNGDLV